MNPPSPKPQNEEDKNDSSYIDDIDKSTPEQRAAAAATTTTDPLQSDRKMNDTTMPPPRYVSSKSNSTAATSSVSAAAAAGKKVVAVNVRSRGPRFGLHDWKRLLLSANDLAQRKGQPLRRDIPRDEIRQHNKNHDGWIILRGKVYNIGPYLPYHPGGIDIFKHVLGKDGDSLFDKYHRWVNIDGLIGPLLIGTAAPPKMASLDNNMFTVIPPKERTLGNAPRVPIRQQSNGTTKNTCGGLLPSPAVDDNEEEEDLLLPPPPNPPSF